MSNILKYDTLDHIYLELLKSFCLYPCVWEK